RSQKGRAAPGRPARATGRGSARTLPRRSASACGGDASAPQPRSEDLAPRAPLRQHRLDHFTAHICQPKVASAVAVGKALVVQAEEVKDGSVQIVDGLRVLGGLVADLV